MRADHADPATLFGWLAGLPASRDTCLECGAGQAELAGFLASRYTRVIAQDIAAKHLAGVRKPVETLCCDAASLPFVDASFDLVVSVQALHHFDVAQHLNEARRVLRKGGIFAAFCWGEMALPKHLARACANTLKALQPYWEPSRPWVLGGYPGLAFAGSPIAFPITRKTRKLTLRQLRQTITGWSAMRRAQACGAEIPKPELTVDQARETGLIEVNWPLLGKVFRA